MVNEEDFGMASIEDSSVDKENDDKGENHAEVNNGNASPVAREPASEDLESRMKHKEEEMERETRVAHSGSVVSYSHSDHGHHAMDNKRLRGASFNSRGGGTPGTARKRRHHHHHHHHEEMNMAELISLSGVESICTISNFDAMSARDLDFDDDEEAGEMDEEEEKGIGVHHVLAVLLALTSIAIILLLFFLVPCPCEPDDWNVELETMVSKSPVRLLDVNKDGMEDVIFGFGYSLEYAPIDDMDQHCQNMNMSSPCGGGVTALSGWRGEALWKVSTNQTITGLVCNQLDANQDGLTDCLASGYGGQLMAIDGKTGTILWTVDQTVTIPSWSYTQPQILPRDLNGDDVRDLVVTHGPESSIDGANSTEPGRVILISGKTGVALGSYLTMPDAMATSCPPVVFQTTDEEDAQPYIVFGSGSASTQGSMWMMSLDQLFCHVTGSSCDDVITQYEQPIGNTDFGHVMSNLDQPVIELVRGSGSGFELPAIIADLTQDGVNDLVVVSQNALVSVLNGSSLETLWSVDRYVGTYRVHSLPAPGLFNKDDIPDLLLHLTPVNPSLGLPDKIVILNGSSGEEMWYTLSMGSDLSPLTRYSPLSLRAEKERDAFAFWMSSTVEDVQTTTQSGRDWCSGLGLSLDALSLVMMDRAVVTSPAILFSTSSSLQHSNASAIATTDQVTSPPVTTLETGYMTPSDSRGPTAPSTIVDITSVMGAHSDSPTPSQPNVSMTMSTTIATPTTPVAGDRGSRDKRNEEGSGCYAIMPVITSTGVIGDFDDDGSLELIVIINETPQPIKDDGDSSIRLPAPVTKILRLGFKEALGMDRRLDLIQDQTFLGPGLENTTVQGDLGNHFELRDSGVQSWMGYMGTNGDGWYTV